jgi:hypothetical protein
LTLTRSEVLECKTEAPDYLLEECEGLNVAEDVWERVDHLLLGVHAV